MTETQALIIRYLGCVPRQTARQVAKAVWPDDPAWLKRTRFRRGRNGAVGGTMPLRAGRMLAKMRERGWVVDDRRDTGQSAWSATITGLMAERDRGVTP